MKYTCEVVKGKGRGKTIVGFPTFNLRIPQDFNEKEGVYASKVWFSGKEYLGALHYGPTPTFDEKEKALEVFVLNYEPEKAIAAGAAAALNPTEITFELTGFLRPIATFADPKKLRHQIALDVARVRRGVNSKN